MMQRPRAFRSTCSRCSVAAHARSNRQGGAPWAKGANAFAATAAAMLLAGSPATAQEFMKSAKEQADLYSKERQKLEQLFSQQSKSAGSAGVRAQEQAKKQPDMTQAIAKMGAPTPEDVQQKPDNAAKEQAAEKAKKEAEEKDRQAKEKARKDAEAADKAAKEQADKAKKEAEEKDRQAKQKAKRDAEAADKAAKDKARQDVKATKEAASKAADKAGSATQPETAGGQAVLSQAAGGIAGAAKEEAADAAGAAKDRVQAEKAAAEEFMKNLKK